jgi:1-pyrroline-4-hydroxy-2-carboxylate deaminase
LVICFCHAKFGAGNSTHAPKAPGEEHYVLATASLPAKLPPRTRTQFTAEGNLDAASCARHFQWQIESGVDGLIVAGSLGESSTLTADQKFELARIAKEVAGPTKQVILTIAEGATSRAIDLARRAEALRGLKIDQAIIYW